MNLFEQLANVVSNDVLSLIIVLYIGFERFGLIGLPLIGLN